MRKPTKEELELFGEYLRTGRLPAKEGEVESPFSAKAQAPKKIKKPLRKYIALDEINYMDKNSFEKMKKGKTKIDAKLDLHGIGLHEARFIFYEFVENARAQNKRCVLVITGKGSFGGGVIRDNLPHWINDSLISDNILSFCTSQPKDGGSGAFYVMLRKG